MSLKGFHILFITLAFLCTAGFCAWTVLEPEKAAEARAIAAGNFSGSLALLLLGYGIWFVVKKSRTIQV